jgi:hypothetical protein
MQRLQLSFRCIINSHLVHTVLRSCAFGIGTGHQHPNQNKQGTKVESIFHELAPGRVSKFLIVKELSLFLKLNHLYRTMVIAMITMWMMQPPINKIVDVISMGNCWMTASWTMGMPLA